MKTLPMCALCAGLMTTLASAASHHPATTEPRRFADTDPVAVTGTAGDSFTITGDDFTVDRPNGLYSTAGMGYLTCGEGGARIATAEVTIPAGVQLRYLDLWGNDDSATADIRAYLYGTCQRPHAPGVPRTTEIGVVQSSGAPGDFFTFVELPLPYSDPRNCSYAVIVAFDSSGYCPANPGTLYKVRVVWQP
ncbi:hypothetical protein FBQ98_02415 [Gammaproteobacteria bacterium PRO6]|nr:hypothetical protein [Gammaproteobacteria bacterium PRO6]